MLNLLPEKERKNVRREYVLRLASVGLFLLAFAFLAGTALLLPAYFKARADVAAARERVALLEESIARRLDAAQGGPLSAAREKMALLSRFSDRPNVHELLQTAAENRTPGVALTGLFYEEKSGGEGWTMTLRGIAAARDPLLSFEKRLERSGAFASVDLPVSNLAKDTDIVFGITLTGPKP